MSVDPALIAADEEARRAALDVSRSFIVQAPAGSGKTELLIQRYLRLLSVVEQPEEVLAITFTRKAAYEMQARILAAMQDASSGVSAKEAHHRLTLDAARRVLERDRRLGWRLFESPHRLRVQTIDALNAAIARSLPVSSGLGAANDVVSDDAARIFYRAAAAATLDWLVSGSDNAWAVERLLLHLDANTALYTRHIARMLETRDQWLGITGTGQERPFDEPAVRQRLERMIAERIDRHLEKVTRLSPPELAPALLRLGCEAAFAAGPRTDPDSSLAPAHGDRRIPGGTAQRLAAWRALAERLLTRAGSWRRVVDRSAATTPGGEGTRREISGLLESLRGHAALADALHRVRRLPAPRYSDEQWSVLLALIRVLPLAVAELRRMFSEERVTDYIEVALAAHAALGGIDDPGDIALILDYGVQHLLIDEMQDTSIAQYQLIEKLVAGWEPGDARTLFCVGDPMQSIYRFRNAEVGEFLLAREQGVGDVTLESLVLRRNFRSGEHLVRWFNRVFAAVFPQDDDVDAGAIAYTEAVPVDALKDRGEVRVHPLFGADPSAEAEQGLRAVRDCLAEGERDSVAVLVRSRAQLVPLLGKLRAAGIDYQALDIDRLTDLPEITDLLALTRALCHRDDRTAWLGLLRGPWIGLTWRDLHALVVNDSRRTVWELVRDDARIESLSADGAMRLTVLVEELSPFLDGHGTRTLQETVERCWYRLGGPYLLADGGQVENVYRFFDVLARLERSGTLTDVAELENRLDQERVATHGAASTRLQVMTMHKAKGLQFDHVVLYALGRRASTGSKAVLSWLNVPAREGGVDFLISPLGARAEAGSDPLHDLIEHALREKERLELDRLLYVACTRARKSLHLVGHVVPDAAGEGFREPQAGSLLQRIWPSLRPDYIAAFAGAARERGEEGGQRIFREPVLHRLTELRPRPPLPPLPGRRPAEVPEAPERTVDYDWAGSAARHAGSVVHRCLQQLTDGRLTEDAVSDAALLSLTGRWAGELGLPAGGVAEVGARARHALDRILRDETGRWLVFGPGHAELPITGVHRGRIESVIIDRVRIDRQGVHWVVDYKTGTHEGGDLDRFLQHEVERYRPQLDRYTSLYRNFVDAPVRAALYFPMLQRFVEVPVGM